MVYQESSASVLSKEKTSNCLGDGKYCVPDPDGPALKGTGRDVLKEILR